MDLKNERLDANDPLRLLFQEIGRTTAPADLEGNVLQKLTVANSAPVSYTPLISKKLWYGIATMLATIIVLSAIFSSVGSTSATWNSNFMQWLHFPQLSGYLMSPWVLAAIAGAFVLTLFDQLITSRVRTMHAL
ncbi:MAG: hypothetical protein WAR83_13600 [Flavobacteriales bacterium]|jgi:hypothetical protein|nr:hypothetical protein [Flavobacteriales bacterium]